MCLFLRGEGLLPRHVPVLVDDSHGEVAESVARDGEAPAVASSADAP